MKKLLAFSLLSSSIFFCANSVKADWDYYGIKSSSDGYKVYTINSSTGASTLRTTKCIIDPARGRCDVQGPSASIDPVSKKLFIRGPQTGTYHSYNLETNTWTDNVDDWDGWRDDYIEEIEMPKISQSTGGDIIVEMAGKKLIEKKSTGEVHIGENSAVFKEEGGREKFWAQDANGKSIPIDITNGSKLLINGRDVEESINNVGALSAALTGLPTVPTNTTLACGLGTGTHGGNFAFSGGCASKVNNKLSINYAASMTMPGQDYAGDFEDTFSARAGFVWKLGKSNKPAQISMQAKEQMEDKINSLEEKNEKILSKNQKLENKVSTLLARLERLEKVALSESKSKNLATIKLP